MCWRRVVRDRNGDGVGDGVGEVGEEVVGEGGGGDGDSAVNDGNEVRARLALGRTLLNRLGLLSDRPTDR